LSLKAIDRFWKILVWHTAAAPHASTQKQDTGNMFEATAALGTIAP
jgi:hypothetical protein